ncbi:MAG: hypothetical protein ACHQ50_05835 [Fimbriimonadales bacterium]
MDTGAREEIVAQALPSPTVRFGKSELTATWGGKFLIDARGVGVMPRDPADGDYALLATGDRLIAGTPSGIFEFAGGKWTQDPLPSNIPTLRPQGIAITGSDIVLGGLSGLYVRRSVSQGSSTRWSQVSKEPVRQVLESGREAWVLYGSGAVDKLDLAQNRLVYDAINEGAKRPWTSCLASAQGMVVFGSQGGWIERVKTDLGEHYFADINKDIVTAAAARGSIRWMGTQKAGLLRYGQGPVKLWNPGNGLTDTWVTALLLTREGLYVATAGEGLFLVKRDTIEPVASPTQRPRQLALYKGAIVVGGMDGAWIQEGSGWRPLATNGEETTAIVAGTRLVICTAAGVYFL